MEMFDGPWTSLRPSCRPRCWPRAPCAGSPPSGSSPRPRTTLAPIDMKPARGGVERLADARPASARNTRRTGFGHRGRDLRARSRAMVEGRGTGRARPRSRPQPERGRARRLIERLLRGMERGGANWTLARRKLGMQRVLDASRSDSRRLQQRLSQLVSSWESDPARTRPSKPNGDPQAVGSETEGGPRRTSETRGRDHLITAPAGPAGGPRAATGAAGPRRGAPAPGWVARAPGGAGTSVAAGPATGGPRRAGARRAPRAADRRLGGRSRPPPLDIEASCSSACGGCCSTATISSTSSAS